MQLSIPNKKFALTIAFVLTLVLGNQALACIFPAMEKMREGQAMACCAETCRYEADRETARQACVQTQIVFSQQPVLTGSIHPTGAAWPHDLLPVWPAGSSGAPWPEVQPAVGRPAEPNRLESYPSVKRFILNRSLLI